MIDLTISCCPLNTSLHIQSLKFTSAPWLNIPTKQLHNFKHTILWNTPFYEADQARHFLRRANVLKYANHSILWRRPSTPSTPIFWSTPITPFYEARPARPCFEARQARHFLKHTKYAKHTILWSTSST